MATSGQGLTGELLKHFVSTCEIDGFCRYPFDAARRADIDAYMVALTALRRAGLIRIEGYRHGLGGFFVYLEMPKEDAHGQRLPPIMAPRPHWQRGVS